MHEAAHRLLFTHHGADDLVGRWLLGYPAFTNTDGYRRVHMAPTARSSARRARHPLYIGYLDRPRQHEAQTLATPPGRDRAEADVRTAAGAALNHAKIRHTQWKILGVQAVLLTSILAGYPGVPLLAALCRTWRWRVINRLRSIAEHGGLRTSKERRRPRTRCAGAGRPASRSCRTTSAGTWRTTSTPASSATCPATTGRWSNPATSPRAGVRGLGPSGGRLHAG